MHVTTLFCHQRLSLVQITWAIRVGLQEVDGTEAGSQEAEIPSSGRDCGCPGASSLTGS